MEFNTDNLKDPEWRNGVKEKAKEKLKKAYDWCLSHQVITAAGIMVVGKVVKAVLKEQKVRRSEQPTRFYDPSAKVYIWTKRPMTRHESLTFSELRYRGYSTYEALSILKLI